MNGGIHRKLHIDQEKLDILKSQPFSVGHNIPKIYYLWQIYLFILGFYSFVLLSAHIESLSGLPSEIINVNNLTSEISVKLSSLVWNFCFEHIILCCFVDNYFFYAIYGPLLLAYVGKLIMVGFDLE